MSTPLTENVRDLPDLRDQVGVFRNRNHAGEILAGMLEGYSDSDAMVMAIPAGGVPVGKVLAEKLSLPFDLAVVSKITLPWNTEAGYGAVAFDGSVRLNHDLVARIGLTEKQIKEGIDKTSKKVAHRMRSLRGERLLPNLSAQQVVLVDDGLASGFTMRAAVEALKKIGATNIVVAVPTGPRSSVERMTSEVDILYCANVRSGWSFAVADAYERWSDVDEEELVALLGGALS
ncbi:MAG: phosphoribosyltransferase [Deltaproteobacteria bacterium]|nr:phosphoribosyltransferase [Deltaproteobacteria bacterium]